MTDNAMNEEFNEEPEEIAVIGLAGRFPGAETVDEFWQNLREGVDSLERFSDEELDDIGIPSALYERDNFVRRGTRLPHMDSFDAGFFGFTPREAAMTDPQARVFLETCYSALEHSGYNPLQMPVPVGVFAGSNPNDYANLLGSVDPTDSLTAFDQLIATDKDFLATRVSHRLNLRGPAINVQTACSTSLVTIHLAARALLDYQCDVALAGGVSVNLRQGVGYFAQQGMILSPDGRCRAFDANANGTTLGQAVGVVVLKRLSEAVADNDTIYGVIKASALNNDGSSKISYTAPSEDGQAEVITLAHALAGVSADDFGYVETHGTGTNLGDPIELAGLRRAFRLGSDRVGYCAIGSVKTNVGHTDAAAGVTSFIKTIMSLHHKEIAPSLHFETPNPALDIETSPFFVNTRLRDWPATNGPRLAGISSFGIGGTNAHAVLSEAPPVPESKSPDSAQVMVLSARSADALSEMSDDLANWLDNNPDASLADAAFTLQTGRGVFQHRLALASAETSGVALRAGGRAGVVRGQAQIRPNVVFMFSGQGAQYASMTRDLYRSHDVFRREFDRCADQFFPLIDTDLRELVFADRGDQKAVDTLTQTQFTQPALFTVEYAMSRQLMAWGITPTALLGHSIGEYAAICIAGVLSLEDGVVAVAARARLMQSMAPGAMLAVHGGPDSLGSLPTGVELAADNTPDLTVVAGAFDALEEYENQLKAASVRTTQLQTSHAFHSEMMAPLLAQYREVLAGLNFSRPLIPIASNVTGDWLSDAQAVDLDFWCSQIRQPVRFQDALATVLGETSAATCIEVGPGRTLVGFAQACAPDAEHLVAISSIRHPKDERADGLVIRDAVGRAWVSGVDIDWSSLDAAGSRRIALPGYRFERKRHWAPKVRHLLAKTFNDAAPEGPTTPTRLPNNQWLYAPSWKRLTPAVSSSAVSYLLIARPSQALDALQKRLLEAGATVAISDSGSAQNLTAVFDTMRAKNSLPDVVVHLLTAQVGDRPITMEQLNGALRDGLESVLDVARELGRSSSTAPMRLDIVTTGVHQVLGSEQIRPEAAPLLGPAKVVPLEYQNIQCRLIDLDGALDESHAATLQRELMSDPADVTSVALRSGHRWATDFAPLALPGTPGSSPLKKGGVYLIVGGLGGVGLSIAEHLATRYQAKLALTSRSGRPQHREGVDDPELTQRIALLERIESAADDLTIVAVDASDFDAMNLAVAKIEQSWGPIDGVIVAAGVADMAGAIHHRSSEANRQSISSKVDGTFILERLFAGRRLDFILLSSSIATALYHNRFGQVGYVSGNSFAEAYGLLSLPSGTPIVSIAWDDWMSLGMSVRAAARFAETYGDDITLMDEVHSFTPAEGVELFERALACGQGLIYVSTTDLCARVREDVHAVSPFLQQALNSDGGNLDGQDGETQLQTVIRVWESLLGFDGINVDDDFFELGGDSLQVARMVDRLNRLLHIELPLNTVFDAKTPRLLDQALNDIASGGAIAHDQSAVEGVVALSPGQNRFLSRKSRSAHHFNVSVVVRPADKVSTDTVLKSVQELYAHHDALRLRLVQSDGIWSQHSESADWDERIFDDHDLSSSDPIDRRKRFARIASEAQGTLDLAEGPLFRALLFDLGEEGQRLLLIAHHLTTDRLSILILIDHLDLLCKMQVKNEALKLPGKSSSFKLWSSTLGELAGSTELDADRERWKAANWANLRKIPTDFEPNSESNLNASGMSYRFKIEGIQAKTLLAGGNGRVDEVLLVALCRALMQWSGGDLAMVDVLGHGRRVLAAPVNIARTVGFFLTYSTVVIDFSDDASASLLEQARIGVDRGWTLDLIREQEMADAPRADMLFNFVGRAIDSQSDSLWTVVEDVDRGAETDPSGMRDHPLAIYIETTNDTIELRLVYSTKLHAAVSIESLADKMVEFACR